MSNVRIGLISKYDQSAGMAAVYYPDRCHEVTSFLPVFSPFGLRQNLKKDDAVLVLHLSNGTEAGIVLGTYQTGASDAEICADGNLVFRDQSGSISLKEIVALKDKL